MTWLGARRRKLDRVDKIQLSAMVGLFVIGFGLLISALVRSSYSPSVVPDRVPYVASLVSFGICSVLIGVVIGFAAVGRTLLRLHRERRSPNR